VTKSGGEAKSYTLLDVQSAMNECEYIIKNQNLEDMSEPVKVKNYVDAMGYMGYVTGAEEDRRKLYITEVRPIRSRKTGKIIGRSLFTKSIGSGKESRFTCWDRVYKQEPVKEGDIIVCKSYNRDGIYFTLERYEKMI